MSESALRFQTVREQHVALHRLIHDRRDGKLCSGTFEWQDKEGKRMWCPITSIMRSTGRAWREFIPRDSPFRVWFRIDYLSNQRRWGLFRPKRHSLSKAAFEFILQQVADAEIKPDEVEA